MKKIVCLFSVFIICACGHKKYSSEVENDEASELVQSVESNEETALIKYEKEWETTWDAFQKALPYKVDDELTLIEGTIANHEIRYKYQINRSYPEGQQLPDEYLKVRKDNQIIGLKTDPSGQLHKYLKKHDLKIVSEFVDRDKNKIGEFEITYLDLID